MTRLEIIGLLAGCWAIAIIGQVAVTVIENAAELAVWSEELNP